MTGRRPARLSPIRTILVVGIVLVSSATVAAAKAGTNAGVIGASSAGSQHLSQTPSTAGPTLPPMPYEADRTSAFGGSALAGPPPLRSPITAPGTQIEVFSVPVGDDPGSVTYDSGNGWVYVTNGDSSNVSVIDGTMLVGSVNVGKDPEFASYDSGNGDVYVPNFGSDNVSVIHGTTVVGTVRVGTGPSFSIYDGADSYEYIVNSFSQNLSVISGTTLEGSVLLDSSPSAETYDSGNGEVYVSNVSPANVSVVSGLSLVANVTVGPETTQGTYDSENGYVYIPNEGGGLGGVLGETVSVIHDTALVGAVDVGSTPDQASFDAANGYVYVPNYYSNNVSVISGTTVVKSVSVGTAPNAPVYDGGNGFVYVANFFSDNVSVINGTKSMSSINVGTEPKFAAVDGGNGYVYVSNLGSNNVSVIEPSAELFHVTFVTNPNSCSLGFAGQTYLNGSTNASVPEGTYPIVAIGCSGQTFTIWTSTAGTVQSPSEASTTVDVTANGTLTASYSPIPPTTYGVTFDTSPTSCTINFEGQKYVNGSTNSSVPAGTYPIVANVCSGETFSSWTSTAGTVGSSTEMSTTLNVTATGTLTASFTSTPPPVFSVTFATVPTACTISFQGKTYAAGSTNSSVLAGTYPIVGNGCYGEVFDSWSSSAGVVTAASSPSTTVAVDASGTLTATYSMIPPTTYEVTFTTLPTKCTISFEGKTYTDGSSNSSIPGGTYPITANSCGGETFKSWTSTVGAVKSSTSSSTTVNVTTAGTLTATYATSSASTPPPSKPATGLTSLEYAVVIGVPITAVAVVAALIFARRNRRATGGPPTPPADSTGTPDSPSAK